MNLRQKTLRGLKTAWLEAGPEDAPLALFFHGFPDAAECWEYQFQGLSDRYRVIAPYARGAGPSEKATRLHRYAPDSAALDALAILDEVDPTRKRKVFIVGHDLGSVHAWHMAQLLGRRAAGLVVINGLSVAQMARRWKNPRQLVKSWYMAAMQVPVLPETLFRAFPARLLKYAHKRGGLRPEFRPPLPKVRAALEGPLNQYRAFAREIPKALLHKTRRLTCPVLVLFGKDDAFLEPPTHEELARDAARLTIRILPGNHWLHRQDHEKVNKLLADFFTRSAGEDRP